ncbi:MAG: hypothetical protein IPP19_02320 [Verrucomicrobia bacterium]|nr:hypothetical protein [Verrucomicrobiota bacterium]
MATRPRATHRLVKQLLAFLTVALLSACKPGITIESFADDEKEQMAQRYIQRLIDGDTTTLSQELHPSLRSGNELTQINQMRTLIPAGSPNVTNLVGYNLFKTADIRRYNLTYQFGYGSKWVLINAAWNELPDGNRQIVGMSVYPLPEPLQQTHAFTFKRARLLHYAFLTAAILLPIFSILTLIVCIRTKLARRKWLWIVFILFGLGQLSLNWTTGQLGLSLLSFQLFSGGAMTSSIYSPWIVSVSLPVGAVLFWIFRNKLKNQLLLPQPAVPDTIQPPPLENNASP